MTIEITQQSVQRPAAQKRKRGFTLTEIAIVLGIIGLILGAIWVAAAAVYNNQRTSHANTAILQTAQAVRSVYASQSTFGVTAATNLTATLITAGAIPADLVNGAAANSVWSSTAGTFIVGTPSTADSFALIMSNVPQAACINLLVAVDGATRDPGLFNATAVASAAPAVADIPATAAVIGAQSPTVAAAAAAAGQGGCTNATNKIIIGFLK